MFDFISNDANDDRNDFKILQSPKHLTTGDDFLVQFAFVLFVFLVDFIGMTIFISIIETTFRFVRKNNVRTNDDDKEMFGFILTQFFSMDR